MKLVENCFQGLFSATIETMSSMVNNEDILMIGLLCCRDGLHCS